MEDFTIANPERGFPQSGFVAFADLESNCRTQVPGQLRERGVRLIRRAAGGRAHQRLSGRLQAFWR